MNSVFLPYSTGPVTDKVCWLPKFCRESTFAICRKYLVTFFPALSSPSLGEMSSIFLKGFAGNSCAGHLITVQQSSEHFTTEPCIEKLYSFLVTCPVLLSPSFRTPHVPRSAKAWVFISSFVLAWALSSHWKLEKPLGWEEGVSAGNAGIEFYWHSRALRANQKQPTASPSLLRFLIQLCMQARKALIRSCPQ